MVDGFYGVFSFCETFKTCCLMGRHLTNGGSANHVKDQFFFGSMAECHPSEAGGGGGGGGT